MKGWFVVIKDNVNIIVLKPGQADWLGARTELGLKKNKGNQNPGWPVNPAKPARKPGCNLLTLIFFY